MRKYIIVFLSAAVLEIGSTFYISVVSDKNYLGMLFFAFIGPFLGLPFVGFMVESKTWKERLNIEVKLVGNYPWVYIDEICGIRVKEKFEGNHGFTLIFLPARTDSPPSDFTDITEIFKLIRKYVREANLVELMRMDEKDGMYDVE